MKAPKLTFTKLGLPAVPKGFNRLRSRQKLLNGDLWAFDGRWKRTGLVGSLAERGLYIRRIGGLK